MSATVLTVVRVELKNVNAKIVNTMPQMSFIELQVKDLMKQQRNFNEYWEAENKLWKLSMAESFRQRDERLKRLDNNKRRIDEKINTI